MDLNQLKALPKDQIAENAKTLTADDIKLLVEALNEKDDVLRYHAFLLLQEHSRKKPSVYAYWDVLAKKLESVNSYHRSIGAMLIAENVRWDKEAKLQQAIDKYFACCTDEKFITSRQTIQGLSAIAAATDKFNSEIQRRLAGLDLGQYKENQQKILKKDIAAVLKQIKK